MPSTPTSRLQPTEPGLRANQPATAPNFPLGPRSREYPRFPFVSHPPNGRAKLPPNRRKQWRPLLDAAPAPRPFAAYFQAAIYQFQPVPSSLPNRRCGTQRPGRAQDDPKNRETYPPSQPASPGDFQVKRRSRESSLG